MRYIAILAMLASLCGCGPPIGSVMGGECKLVHTPSFAVKSTTEMGQEWVDDTTEALVRGCKQPRPKAPTAATAAKHWWQK